MKTEWILELKDMLSAPLKQIKQSADNAFASMKKHEKEARFEAGKLVSSMTMLRSQIDALKTLRDISFNKEEIRKYNGEIRALERNLSKLENLPPRGFKDRILSAGTALKTYLGAAAAGAITYALGSIGRKAIDASAAFEKYQAVLENATGSKSQAVAGMQMLVDFASKTPFQVDEITESYIKLVNRGFRPTKDELTALGDISAATGKGFDQLMEAIMDAEMGQFQRLLDFGIKAEKQGEKMSFTWKGVTKTVERTPEAVRAAFIEFGKMEGVSGTMQSISQTMGGMLSNLQDTTLQALKDLGDGIAPLVKPIIESLGNALNVLRDFGGWLRENKEEVVNFFEGLAIAAIAVGSAYLYYEWTALAAEIATWSLTAAIEANPFGLLAMAITAGVLALKYMWDNFKGFRAFLYGFGATLKDLIVGPLLFLAGLLTGNVGWMKDGLKAAKNALTGASFKEGYGAGEKAFDEEKAKERAAKEEREAARYGMDVVEYRKLKRDAENAGMKTGDYFQKNYNPANHSILSNNKKTPGADDASASSGSGSGKNLSVLIEQLVGAVNIYTTNIGNSEGQIKEAITRVLVGAVRDAEISLGR